jgi:hypothetical protein
MTYISTDVLSNVLEYSDISKKRVSKIFRDAEILADKERMIRNTDKELITYALDGEWDRVRSVFDTHKNIHILRVATVAKILQKCNKKIMFNIIYQNYDLFDYLNYITTNGINYKYIIQAINMKFDNIVLYISKGSRRISTTKCAAFRGNEELVNKLINKPFNENIIFDIAERFASGGFPDMMERFSYKHKINITILLSRDYQEDMIEGYYPKNTVQWFHNRGYEIDYNSIAKNAAEENDVETIEYLISIGATDFDNIAAQAAGHQAKDVVEMMINKYNVDPDLINHNMMREFDTQDREWYNSTYGYN